MCRHVQTMMTLSRAFIAKADSERETISIVPADQQTLDSNSYDVLFFLPGIHISYLLGDELVQNNPVVHGALRLLTSCFKKILIISLFPDLEITACDRKYFLDNQERRGVKKLYHTLLQGNTDRPVFLLYGQLCVMQLLIETGKRIGVRLFIEFQHGWIHGKSLWKLPTYAKPSHFLCLDAQSLSYIKNTYPEVKPKLLGHYPLIPSTTITSGHQERIGEVLRVLLCTSQRDVELGYQSSTEIYLKPAGLSVSSDAFGVLSELSRYQSLEVTVREKSHTMDPLSSKKKSYSDLISDILNADLVLSSTSTVNIQAASLGVPSIWLSSRISPTTKALFDAYPEIPHVNVCLRNGLDALIHDRNSLTRVYTMIAQKCTIHDKKVFVLDRIQGIFEKFHTILLAEYLGNTVNQSS